MDLSDDDLERLAEADRREVDPPVEEPRGPQAALSTGGSKNASSGWAEYAVQTDVNGGSKPVISAALSPRPV
jgi:hypothetical protein